MPEAQNATYSTSEIRFEDNGFSAQGFVNSPRFVELDRRASYFDCTQHDRKIYDFDGRVIQSGKALSFQPLISSERASWFVPLTERRPSTPYRLAKSIVGAFTNMVFGDHRFPTLRVPNDTDAQAFASAIVASTSLPLKMIEARNHGGSTGTAGLSYCWQDGKPVIDVHNGRNLHVHEWADFSQRIPAHVSEVYQYKVSERDPNQSSRFVERWYWYRRDWTTDADVIFVPQPVDVSGGKREPMWVVDTEKSRVHNEGRCHFVWVQNLPSNEADGECDYEGLFEQLDQIDILYSGLMHSAKKNLDPTVVLNMDFDLVKFGVKKGSDNAIVTGVGGNAGYMETSGAWLTTGLSLFASQRSTVLEVAQCVIPDPDKLAAAGLSSVAIKAIFMLMLGKLDILRQHWGSPIVTVVSALMDSARMAVNDFITVPQTDPVTGEIVEVEADLVWNLPPRFEKRPVFDPETGEQIDEQVIEIPHNPGKQNPREAKFGPYFLPTPDDRQKDVQTAQSANGGQPVLSQQTSAEYVATNTYGIDPDEEWKRILAEKQAKKVNQAQMFPSMGGEVENETDLPPGMAPVTE